MLASLVIIAALSGADLWGMRVPHPAVVNPVVPAAAEADVLSLRGDWSFTTEARNVPVRNGIWGQMQLKDWKQARTIRVPGCWEAQGVGEPAMSQCWDATWDAGPKPLRHVYMGEGWYRRDVTVPAAWTDKRVWLKIGGVKQHGWVFVNGVQVAHLDTYCETVKYDITDLVEPGKTARIVFDVDNRKTSRKGLMSYLHRWGGIYRDVELEATPSDVWLDDVWVRGDFDGRKAEVKVKVEGQGLGQGQGRGQGRVGDEVGQRCADFILRMMIEGETVEAPIDLSNNQTIKQSNNQTIKVPLRDFRPWSPEHPNLYTAKVELVSADGRVLQTRFERFGVRKLEVRGKDFYLNGKPLCLRGFGDDFVYPLEGMSPADRDVHRAHLAKARAAGFNFVRLHTHCELPEYFEAADELGVLIQAELPYYSDVPGDGGPFDPKRDVTELWRTCRRHPSFAVYSMGNEGSFGDALDRHLHAYVKAMDPDRLKINQDCHVPAICLPDRADFAGGPTKPWPRGSFTDSRPVVPHEYLNLCVKLDSRLEKKFSGVWQPPVTRADRAAWLAKFGLDHVWGDRLQDAQHALQAVWQKDGIESARFDPETGGYIFWTIVDVVVHNKAAETYSAQGLFNPVWEDKPHGLTASDFAMFNSPSCVLLDLPITNRVHTVGEKVPLAVSFAHYGEAPIERARLTWRLVANGRELAVGDRDIGPQALGRVRPIAAETLTVPEIFAPVAASLELSVVGGPKPVTNVYPLWLFPRGETRAQIVRRAAKAGVVVAKAGSPEATAAVEAGKALVTVDGTAGRPNVSLGWWNMGTQVGLAIKDHPVFGDFPHAGVLSPLLFRLVKKGGMPLTPALAADDELIVVGEGGTACYAYLTHRRVGTSHVLAFHGLDVLNDTPEANALLQRACSWLQKVSKTLNAEPPADVELVRVRSSLDGSDQLCWFWAPEKAKTEAVPLIVGFHTWSYDYTAFNSYASVYKAAKERGWAFVGPNFRGPNKTPDGCGSDRAVQDIVDAVGYAKARVKVDPSRVYLIGGSGGGHITLLMLGRHPEIFAAGAAFCPITDLARWHADSRLDHPGRGRHYAEMLEAACGGTPSEHADAYAHRSPLTWLARAKAAGVLAYICTGIHDGWKGSVPVGHAIRGYNALADEADRISEEDIAFIEANQKVPDALAFSGKDPFYAASNRVHLRKTSRLARLTLFEGAHGGNFAAGIDFLARQAKGQPADWTLPAEAASARIEAVTK